MVRNIIIFIFLLCLNILYIDYLLFGRKPKWVPFVVSPKKWYHALLSEEDETTSPTMGQFNYSNYTNFESHINETAEETERKKAFYRQKMADDTMARIRYIKDFETNQASKKNKAEVWIENIQVYGLLITIANLAFILFLVFNQPAASAQKSLDQEPPSRIEGQRIQQPKRSGE